MRKILNTAQIKEADAYTIANEPVSSINLMERAAKAFVRRFTRHFNRHYDVKVFCGPGNNGGDGLAIARLLHKKDYGVEVFILSDNFHFTSDFLTNESRLIKGGNESICYIKNEKDFPEINSNEIIIDALWGTGLSRPILGLGEKLITYLNQQKAKIVSVDIPSGLGADPPQDSVYIRAKLTITFQSPKLSFLFPENFEAVGEWERVDIGLSKKFIDAANCSDFYLEEKDVRKILHPRQKFDHKGKFGHALIVSGSAGKIGAAILCSHACLKTGAGLITVHIPRIGNQILQSTLPEVMLNIDEHENIITRIGNTDSYSTIGIGSGIGQEPLTQQAFLDLLNRFKKPMVIDADALNILWLNKKWLSFVHPESILTPHPKEFERLFGKTKNSFERLTLQKKKSIDHKIIIVLKGAHTCITTPQGNAFFNSTGNPGMAKGGSGDVLTGMITSFLAQGYNSEHAAIMGVYLHGLAGDVAVKKETNFNLTSSELINHIPDAFKKVLQ